MNKLTSYTIKEVHKAYRDKLLTPTSFVDLCLQRARQTAEYNAFVTLTEDIAENDGIESEKRFYIDKKIKPLDGITIGMKDNFCTSNVATTCASEMLKNFVPTYDATVYARLKAAGACLIGKCNLDEFAMGSGTVDSIFGPTRNPWKYDQDNWRIAGGSSGGSAVAVSSATLTSEILTKLNISIGNLPPKCQQSLHQISRALVSSGMVKLDPVGIALQQHKETAEAMDNDYEILLLRQKDQELQAKIDKNKKFLEQLRKDLEVSRSRLHKKDPNPDNIEEYCRQMKLKVATYENSYEKAKAKLKKREIPPEITPQGLLPLIKSLEQLCAEAAELRQAAEDISLAREARGTLLSLKNKATLS